MENPSKTSIQFESTAEIIEARRAVFNTHVEETPITAQLDQFLGHVVIDGIAPSALVFIADARDDIMNSLVSEAAKDDGKDWSYAMAKNMLKEKPKERKDGGVPRNPNDAVIMTEDFIAKNPDALRKFANG